MPDFSTPLGTGSINVPLIKKPQRFRQPVAEHLCETKSERTAAIDEERLRIERGLTTWLPGCRVRTAGEPGHREWAIDTAGSTPAERAAASHARTVVLGTYRALLAADINDVLTTTGAPASGTGADGDLAFDAASTVVYLKSAGAWSAVASSTGQPRVQASRTGASNATAGDANSVIPFSATGDYTLPTGLGVGSAFAVELRAMGGFNVTATRGAGVTMIVDGANTATAVVANEGSSIEIHGTDTPNKFLVYKLGN